MKSLEFNGIRKSWLYLLGGRQKAPFAPRRNNLLQVPGMPGAYYKSEEIDVLYITQPVGFVVEDDEDALKKKDELAEWLLTGEPVELKFDDEPGRTYYAKIEGTIEDFNKFVDQRSGTLTFLCPDPYAYGPEKTFSVETDYFNIENKGTAEAEPIFELEVKEPITFAMLQNQFDEYNMIGRPIEEGEIPTKPYDRIANLTLGTLVGWSPLTAGSPLPGGIVGGEMRTTGASFEVASYGTNPNGWVGPAVKRSFSEPLQNFAIDITVTSRNTQGVTGKLQALLLDSADNVVATMSLIDGTIGIPKNSAVFTVGNKTIMNEAGDFDRAYNNETVHLNLSRTGRSIVAYAYKQTGSVRTGRVRRTYRDEQMEHQAPIASIILYIAKYKNYDAFPMSFNRLIADKNYLPSELEIPYIAQPGDIITFDHTDNGQIYINGEPYEDTILGADYFTLKKGDNNIIALPNGAFESIRGKYRERYL